MIKIDKLSRTYGDFVAVSEVSFSIAKGEIVGLLGHNGAGKTTIMKMMSGYLEPSAGQIIIDGLDIANNRTVIQKHLGYLPETLPLYPEMAVAEYLDYCASLKGLSGVHARDEIRRVVRATDINSKLLSTISTLSRGYKQRVGMAQAILGKPSLLILDEPTNGLDPTQTQQMRELIREIAKDATVILSTHIMQEVDALCDRALIMRSGRLAVDKKLEVLRNSNTLLVNSDMDSISMHQRLIAIEGVDRIDVQSKSPMQAFQITVKPKSDFNTVASQIAKVLIENNHALYELKREQRDLEHVFREVNEQDELQEVFHAA